MPDFNVEGLPPSIENKVVNKLSGSIISPGRQLSEETLKKLEKEHKGKKGTEGVQHLVQLKGLKQKLELEDLDQYEDK